MELNLNNKEGFKVPNNYLEDIEKNININVKLHISKENSFKVEDNYFDNLEQDILSKTVNKPKSAKQIKLWMGSIAASILLVFVVIYNFDKDTDKAAGISDTNISDVTEGVYEKLYTNYLDDRDEVGNTTLTSFDQEQNDFYEDKPLYSVY